MKYILKIKKLMKMIKEKEKIIKPKINLYLTKNSLDEELIKKEIINDKNEQKNDDNKNYSIISPVKRKLNSIDIGKNKINDNDNNFEDDFNNNDDNGMLKDVFSFEAYGGNDIEEDKEQEEIKKIIIYLIVKYIYIYHKVQ